MIKVYQTIIDKGHGNCMQAAIASLFELSLDDVPNFIEFGHDWSQIMYEFIKKQGYDFDGTLYNYNRYRIINERKNQSTVKGFKNRFHIIKNMKGVNGYFYASVYSPKYYNSNEDPATTHAVIIDRDYNIVHDVNSENTNIITYPESKLLKYNGILNISLINPI